MPVLGEPGSGAELGSGQHARASSASGRRFPASLVNICANPGCASGWLRLWRARQAPVFEGGWLCSPECVRARLRAAVARELQGHAELGTVHRHRVPLGLLLLSQGTISRDQLRAALARQSLSGGRVGMWLTREHGIRERCITRALGTQWGCPVLTLENDSPERASRLAPRLLADAFGFLPLQRAGSALLYVGFEDRVDRCVSLAMERMTGFRVEVGVIDGSDFALAHRRLLATAFPPCRMVEAKGAEALASAFTRILEAARPVEARLVRMHDYFWLRMWKRCAGDTAPQRVSGRAPAGSFEDVLGSLVGAEG